MTAGARVLGYTFAFAYGWFMLYLMGSFASASLDIGSWEPKVRYIMTGFALIWSAMVAMHEPRND